MLTGKMISLQTNICRFLEILSILEAVSAVVISNQSAKYGEPCGGSIKCNSTSALVCAENICNCINPDEMMYDIERQKCVVLLGEKCFYTSVEIVTEEFQWTEKLECAKNANCSSDGYCDCDLDHFDFDGACELKRYLGESCKESSECMENSFLSCISGVCSCNETSVFDEISGRCHTKAGSSCNQESLCVAGSECSKTSGNHICLCIRPQWRVTGDGRCMVDHGQACGLYEKCWNEFDCIDGICQCRFPSLQTYDQKLGRCVSQVMGPCLEVVGGGKQLQGYDCSRNAECRDLNGFYACSCSNGYIEYKKECVVAHGYPCIMSSDCDPHSGSICRNGRCSCPDWKEYDSKKNECLGLVGGVCNPMLRKNLCVEKAYCQFYRGLHEGTCKCRNSTDIIMERKCISAEN